jgi:hypothetical protein
MTRQVLVLEEFIRLTLVLFLVFLNDLSRYPGKVSKIWEKYFHSSFKVLSLSHFRPPSMQRRFLHSSFQTLSYFGPVKNI